MHEIPHESQEGKQLFCSQFERICKRECKKFNVYLLDRRENTDFIECILPFFLGELSHFNLR